MGMSMPAFLRRTPVVPEVPAPPLPPAEVTAGPADAFRVPPRWAAAMVAVVLGLGALLVGTGTPVGVALEILGGGGYVATEIVRRLNGAA
jgi:hypothetical protein